MTSMSARMVAAADGGDGDLLSWVARHGDEASCEEGLMRLRFPGGWVCPRCGNRRCSPVAGRPRKRQCTRCRLQFLAFRLVAGSKRGVSAAELARALGTSETTARYVVLRLRGAMSAGLGRLRPGLG